MTTITCNTVLLFQSVDYFSQFLYTLYYFCRWKPDISRGDEQSRKQEDDISCHCIYFSLTTHGAIETAPSEKHLTD